MLAWSRWIRLDEMCYPINFACLLCFDPDNHFNNDRHVVFVTEHVLGLVGTLMEMCCLLSPRNHPSSFCGMPTIGDSASLTVDSGMLLVVKISSVSNCA